MASTTVIKQRHLVADHAQQLLRHLHLLYKRGEFCDITLQVGRAVFRAHRSVLSAASPYFHALLAGGLAETGKNEVDIHGVDADVFKALIDFIYTGEVEVSQDNCQDLLSAANMLELSEVLEACCNFLTKQLHPSNCLGIYLFADSHGCLDLRNASESYFHNHFTDTVQEEEFVSLPKEILMKTLHSENLNVDNEFQVFKAAMEWILYEPARRRHYVFDILSPIRIPIISDKILEKYVEECEDLSLKIALRKLLQDFKSKRKVPYEMKMHRLKPHMFQPRKCSRRSIYMVGGYSREIGGRWSDSQTLCSVECFNCFNQQWTSVAPLRHARSSHAVCVLNGMIYAIGGENDSLIFDNAECYDPSTNKWSMIPSMTAPRCGFGACVVEENIYVIGGWVGSQIGDSVERYDPLLGHWSQVDKLPTLRFATGVIAHQGLIYIVGGMSDVGIEMSTVESYNPVTKEWTRLAPMRMARAHPGVAVLDNHLYAVGGWNEDAGALDSVEKYSIDENSWSSICVMSITRAGASSVAINGLLYVIGGRTSGEQAHAPHTLDSVECFDPQTDSWFDLGPMPTGRCEAGIAVI